MLVSPEETGYPREAAKAAPKKKQRKDKDDLDHIRHKRPEQYARVQQKKAGRRRNRERKRTVWTTCDISGPSSRPEFDTKRVNSPVLTSTTFRSAFPSSLHSG